MEGMQRGRQVTTGKGWGGAKPATAGMGGAAPALQRMPVLQPQGVLVLAEGKAPGGSACL